MRPFLRDRAAIGGAVAYAAFMLLETALNF